MILEEILKNEERNSGHIYLYQEEDGWYAYEQSAFYCYSLLGILDIGWLLLSTGNTDSMVIRVRISNIDRLLNAPLLKLLTQSDTQCVVLFRNSCGGFHYWRNEQETKCSYFHLKNNESRTKKENNTAWVGVVFNQDRITEDTGVTPQQSETPTIDSTFDPLTQRRDGTVTSCAPVLISGHDFLCWPAKRIELCVCPVEEPGRLIPVPEVFRHTEKEILVTLPDLIAGEYHPVFRLIKENEELVYYFPDTWQVRNLSPVDVYIDRHSVYPVYYGQKPILD